MKTHHLITTSPLAFATESPDGVHPIARAVGNPAAFSAPDGYAYIPDVAPPTYDSEAQTIERNLTLKGYGWVVRELTAEDLAARQPTLEQQLTTARSSMSELIYTLPVAARAKFATARAGVEKLLDLGDIAAAHYALGEIAADTEAEQNVKLILLTALNGFLP